MECPHCKYETGFNINKNTYEEAKSGEFFKLGNNIKMEKEDFSKITRSIFGCPKCKKLFMSNN